MNNKEQIKKLKDNSELAWAAYGYFDLVGKKFGNNNEYKGRENTKITFHDIIDSTCNGYIAMGKDRWGQDIEIGSLKGDMTSTQAKRFFERYDLLKHCPNTDSGFSATLFGEKRKQINSKTKEESYTSEYGYINYILAIRGTDPKEAK